MVRLTQSGCKIKSSMRLILMILSFLMYLSAPSMALHCYTERDAPSKSFPAMEDCIRLAKSVAQRPHAKDKVVFSDDPWKTSYIPLPQWYHSGSCSVGLSVPGIPYKATASLAQVAVAVEEIAHTCLAGGRGKWGGQSHVGDGDWLEVQVQGSPKIPVQAKWISGSVGDCHTS